MRFRQVLIVAMVIILFLVPNVVTGDPIGNPNDNLIIEGAHIVSEGAYFRFLMVNRYGFPIYVTVNDGASIYIPTDGSVNYNVIAPQISVPYEEVKYTFKEYDEVLQPDHLMATVDFPVTVLAYDFIDFIVLTNIIIAIGLFAVVIAFIIWHRRLFSGKVKLNTT